MGGLARSLSQVAKPEELTADDLDTLAKLQRTDFEPRSASSRTGWDPGWQQN